ncbi:MAG: hypothetical protein ACRDG7_18835, partial [Candidatus Limnocylindria bacterium]
WASHVTLAERALKVDGYWVWINEMQFDALHVSRVAQLCFGLEDATDRPVLLSGADRLHLPFLASGLAATSIGPGENKKFAFPPPRPPAKDKKGSRPRRLPLFHDETLYSFAYRREGEWADRLAEAFEHYSCECGHHQPDRPPENNTETKRHTTSINLAHVGAVRDAADPEAWLTAKLASATGARAWLRLRPLESGWRAVQPVAETIRSAGDIRQVLGL